MVSRRSRGCRASVTLSLTSSFGVRVFILKTRGEIEVRQRALPHLDQRVTVAPFTWNLKVACARLQLRHMFLAFWMGFEKPFQVSGLQVENVMCIQVARIVKESGSTGGYVVQLQEHAYPGLLASRTHVESSIFFFFWEMSFCEYT